MTDEIVLIAYALLAGLGIFTAVLALLRLRRENQELCDRLRAFEVRSDEAEPAVNAARPSAADKTQRDESIGGNTDEP